MACLLGLQEACEDQQSSLQPTVVYSNKLEPNSSSCLHAATAQAVRESVKRLADTQAMGTSERRSFSNQHHARKLFLISHCETLHIQK